MIKSVSYDDKYKNINNDKNILLFFFVNSSKISEILLLMYNLDFLQ